MQLQTLTPAYCPSAGAGQHGFLLVDKTPLNVKG